MDISDPQLEGVTMSGSSTQGIKTVLHPVSDPATAKEVYAALLGIPLQTDSSYYVGFEAAAQHIGLVPGGWTAGHTLAGGLLARGRPRGEAGPEVRAAGATDEPHFSVLTLGVENL
jgi:hypothetical protein